MIPVKGFTKNFYFVFILIFLLGFIIRCLILNWTLQYGNNGDLTRYESWARIAHVSNFAATYITTSRDLSYVSPPNDQAPGLLYIVSGTYELWILTGKIIARATHTLPGSITAVNTYLQHIFMKFPPMLTDLGMGLLVYLMVSSKVSKKNGLLAASLILFNPVIFYNSAVWGQTDSLNNFFFLLSLFFAFRKNIIFSLLAYAASLYIKLSLLPLLPFYFIFLFFVSSKDYKKILIGTLLSIIAYIIATFPISTNPLQWLIINLPKIAGGELQHVTNAAFNFWMVVACFPTVCDNNVPLVNQIFLSVPLGTWAYGFFAIFTLPLLYFQIKKSKNLIALKNAFLLFSLIALISFLFLPAMHDRYMYPVFPLLAVFIALEKRRVFAIIFILLSLIHLDNLIYSWNPIVFDSKTTFYHIFYGPYLRWILSILTLIVGGVFYYQGLKTFGMKS